MSEKPIKNVFITGEIVSLNGEIYTRLLSKEEAEMLKNAPARTQEELDATDKRMMERLKIEYPDFYKKIYGEKDEILFPI